MQKLTKKTRWHVRSGTLNVHVSADSSPQAFVRAVKEAKPKWLGILAVVQEKNGPEFFLDTELVLARENLIQLR